MDTAHASASHLPKDEQVRARYRATASKIDYPPPAPNPPLDGNRYKKGQDVTREHTVQETRGVVEDPTSPPPPNDMNMSIGSRVKPRNPQHAKELGRNRAAASKYRKKQKVHTDALVQRARQQQNTFDTRRRMVAALQEELYHLQEVFLHAAGMAAPMRVSCNLEIKEEEIETRVTQVEQCESDT